MAEKPKTQQQIDDQASNLVAAANAQPVQEEVVRGDSAALATSLNINSKIGVDLDDPKLKERAVDPEEKEKILDELERTYWKRMGKRMLKEWRLYLMLFPLLAVFILWRYLPLYELIAAFKVNSNIVPVLERDFAGFFYFWSLAVGPDSVGFWPAFRNTFVLSFYGLLFGFPVPIILALFFNEVKNNIARSVFQILTYLPKFVSTVVVTTIIHMLLREGSVYQEPGVLALVLSKLNLISYETAQNGMLFVPSYFRAIYQISGIWEAAGYGSIVYFAAIISIPPTSYEAAVIDGAGKFAQIRYVVLPGIMSTIVIMLVLRIGELLNVGYEKVLLLYDVRTFSTADIVSTYVFRRAGMDGGASGGTANASLGSAADLVAALLSMVLVVGSNFISKRISKVSLY